MCATDMATVWLEIDWLPPPLILSWAVLLLLPLSPTSRPPPLQVKSGGGVSSEGQLLVPLVDPPVLLCGQISPFGGLPI